MQKIIKENIDSFEEQTAIGLIELASNEMTAQQQKVEIFHSQSGIELLNFLFITGANCKYSNSCK